MLKSESFNSIPILPKTLRNDDRSSASIVIRVEKCRNSSISIPIFSTIESNCSDVSKTFDVYDSALGPMGSIETVTLNSG